MCFKLYTRIYTQYRKNHTGLCSILQEKAFFVRGDFLKFAKQLSIAENSFEIETIFGWEAAHRSEGHRKRRKIERLIIDEITFVLSGIGTLIGFQVMMEVTPACSLQILSDFEIGFTNRSRNRNYYLRRFSKRTVNNDTT